VVTPPAFRQGRTSASRSIITTCPERNFLYSARKPDVIVARGRGTPLDNDGRLAAGWLAESQRQSRGVGSWPIPPGADAVGPSVGTGEVRANKAKIMQEAWGLFEGKWEEIMALRGIGG